MGRIDMFEYNAEGRDKNLVVSIRTVSYGAACRAARGILRDHPQIETANVKNRKGEVIKVVHR